MTVRVRCVFSVHGSMDMIISLTGSIQFLTPLIPFTCEIQSQAQHILQLYRGLKFVELLELVHSQP